MTIKDTEFKKMHLIRLNPNDDIYDGLYVVIKERNIQNALILTGLGSVKSHHYHVVASTENPPKEYYPKGEAAADILNINGAVINGRLHAHIALSNQTVSYGGHLERGTEILTFAIIIIVEIENNLDKWDYIGDLDELLK